jgi:hypothetical protein
MNIQLARPAAFPLFLLLALIIAGLDFIMLHNIEQERDMLALGIACDLVLTIPLLYYFLVVRKREKRSWLAVLPVVALGAFAGSELLPAEQSRFLNVLMYLAPAVELALVAYTLFKLRTLVRTYRELRAHELHFQDALRKSLIAVLGETTFVKIMSTEIAMWYYAVGVLFKKPRPLAREGVQAFTYHQSSGFAVLVCVFGGLIVLETCLMHYVISMWSTLWAWVSTASDLYLILFGLAYFNSVRHSPILVSEEGLNLHIGFTNSVHVELSNVAAVRSVPMSYDEKRDKKAFYAVLFGCQAQYEVELKEPVTAHGPFGKKRVVERLFLCVDEPQRFLSAVQTRTEE